MLGAPSQRQSLRHVLETALSFNNLKLGSIRCKHIVRWQYLSQIKARLFGLVENIFFQLKMLQAKSGTSAATYDLMEPHWCQDILGFYLLES